jgi:uncharacterized protein (DUF2252 family)
MPRSAAAGRDLATVDPPARPEDRAARGKACRSTAPRSAQGEWSRPTDRPDPIALLEAQSAQRVPELVPIRYGRMSASPFAFFRGAAAVMALDLSGTPRTEIVVQLCGDAHLANFGAFASPERELLFDLVDFDETLPGPWEWDVKRLAASVAVAGRDNGFSQARREAIVRELVARYRTAMRQFATMKTLEVWYARASVDEVQELFRSEANTAQIRRFDSALAKGQRKDSAHAFEKLAVKTNGDARIRADPPLILPISDLFERRSIQRFERGMQKILESYLQSLAGDRRQLLERFRYADLARKVVGVGSVGTQCWVTLLLGRDSGDALFLQAKEATNSVLEPFTRKSEFANQGQRVVEGQRLMQAASDIFLGWTRAPLGMGDRASRDLYVRQLWDSKISVDITSLRAADMTFYAGLCAWTLARAHARSGDSIAIANYLGSSDVFDRAIAAFAEAYADQNERDHAALLAAISSGRIEAERDV